MLTYRVVNKEEKEEQSLSEEQVRRAVRAEIQRQIMKPALQVTAMFGWIWTMGLVLSGYPLFALVSTAPLLLVATYALSKGGSQ